MSIATELGKLNTQRNNLAANLTAKGVTASSSETLAQLVPKVLDIAGGGGGPTGDGTTDVYTLTTEQSGGSYTGMSINMAIKGNWWLESIIFKPVSNIIGGTINLRAYSGDILQTIHNVNIAAAEVGTVSLNEPILLNNGMLLRIEILYNGSMKHYRRTSFGYDGVLWKSGGININTWAGADYQEQLYIGLAEYLG